MKRAIVVGANGFLGSNLTKYLTEQKVDVFALVQNNSDYHHLLNLRNITIFEFDLDNIADFHLLPNYDFDVLFQLAWIGVSSSDKNDINKQTQNIINNIKIIDFAKTYRVKKVIFPGTASEFSCSNEVITGYNVPAPSDIYSAVKLSVRYISSIYAKQKEVNLIWTFIGSVYGPGRDDNNLITYTIKSLLSNQTPKYTKLEQKWDYIYIKDLVKALYLIALKGKVWKNYPIGSGYSNSLLEYVQIIRNYINSELILDIGKIPYKSDIIDNQIIDISSLSEDTGFTPEYSFDKGIKETIDFYKNRQNV